MSVSVQVAMMKIIDEVKKVKRGLHFPEIEKRANVIISPALREKLLANEHLIYDEEEERLKFKFKYSISSKDEIMTTLAEADHRCLNLDEDFTSSYDNILADVEALKREHKILSVYNETDRVQMIYLNPYQVPDDSFPWEMDPEIKDLWHRVPRMDYVDLKNYLLDRRVSLASLDTNKLAERAKRVREKKRGPKQIKKVSQRTIKSDMSFLSRQLRLLRSDDDNEETTVKLERMAPEDADAESAKKAYLEHNVAANPLEWDWVCRLVRTIGHWFYEDGHVIVLDSFLRQKIYRESDLREQVKLSIKQTAQFLVKLNAHQLVTKTICETPGRTSQAGRNFNMWALDLDRFVNTVNYRLLRMKDVLRDEREELARSIFFCSFCRRKYTALDQNQLLDHISGSYYCINCKRQVSVLNSEEEIARKAHLLERLDEDLAPLYSILKELAGASADDDSYELLTCLSHYCSFPVTVIYRLLPYLTSSSSKLPTNLRRYTWRSGGSYNRTGTNVGGRNITGVGASIQENLFSDPKAVEEAIDVKVEPLVEFNLRPLLFSRRDNLIYVPVAHTWDEFRPQYSIRLAKEVLDDIAELVKIVNAHVYVYRISIHSLFLAATRGFSAAEVVRILSQLSRNPMPRTLERLIRTHCVISDMYKATTTLRNGSYVLQSNSLKDLEDFLSAPSIRLLIQDPTQIMQVTTKGSDVVVYYVTVQDGKLEALKHEARKLDRPLIDEYDFATSDLPDIRINLRAAITPRDYQRASVQKLFWNGFRCHSGVLVLPCGAGKTLIGIDVICAVKKPSIIFCNSILALNQWKDQIKKWSDIHPDSVVRFSGEHANEWNSGESTAIWNARASIIVTTYQMFSQTSNRNSAALDIMEKCKTREWGVLVLDEVHLAPARIFRQVTNQIRAHIKLGLTATAVREDNLIEELPNLVGPTLFELDIFTLRMRNHIAPVHCVELHCPLTDIFAEAYNAATTKEARKLIYSCNPNKARIVGKLMREHLALNRKIMVFCDNIFSLQIYSQVLEKPILYGKTPHTERAAILANFRRGDVGDCVVISQVGDQSIDLPEAEVVIQLSLASKSRMQEGQRIGRIQRPAPGKTAAYFYSLVCDDTKEEDYAKVRRHFLEDHGYTVTVKKDDDWKSFITADTIKWIDPSVQHHILGEITKELIHKEKERSNERANGGARAPTSTSSSMTTSAAVRASMASNKRKADTKIDQLRRAAKRQRTDISVKDI